MKETFIDNKCKDENYKLSKKKKIERLFIDENWILKWLDIFAPLYFTTTLEIVEGNFERTFFFWNSTKESCKSKKKKNYSVSAAVIIAPQKNWRGKYGPKI